MSRIGITYEDVASAIANLQGQQRNPSVDAIREVLRTGSKSTIARFLREWKAEHGLQSSDDATLPSELLEMVKGLWTRLQDKSHHQTTEYQQEADLKMANMQQQLHRSQQLQANAEAKIHELEEQLHQQAEENKRFKNAVIAHEQEAAKKAERITSLETRRQESLAENERLHQLLNHVQANLEHYQNATQQLRQEQTLLVEKQRGEYEQKLLQSQHQTDVLIDEKAHYQAQYNQISKVYETLEIEQKNLVLKSSDTQKQLESLKITHDKLQQEYEQLLQKYHDQAKQLETKQHSIIELQLTLKSENNKVVSLEEILAKANDKVDALGHDYQFLSQEKANLEGQLKQLQTMLGR